MSNELKKRIITSFFLFIFLYMCIFINSYFTLSALLILSIISLFEFNKLIFKIFNKFNFLALLSFVLSFFYLLIFSGITYYLIVFDNFYFSYILFICAFSDIGGYVFGKTFKGKTLTKISPNKTYAGTYGSFIFALIPVFILKLVYTFSSIEIFSFANNFILNGIVALYLSLICQLGDIFISYFKRLAKVKDTGKILPGHGGLLDRIDGIIFAIPALGILGSIINY